LAEKYLEVAIETSQYFRACEKLFVDFSGQSVNELANGPKIWPSGKNSGLPLKTTCLAKRHAAEG
jgi:hypothetical protein